MDCESLAKHFSGEALSVAAETMTDEIETFIREKVTMYCAGDAMTNERDEMAITSGKIGFGEFGMRRARSGEVNGTLAKELHWAPWRCISAH